MAELAFLFRINLELDGAGETTAASSGGPETHLMLRAAAETLRPAVIRLLKEEREKELLCGEEPQARGG